MSIMQVRNKLHDLVYDWKLNKTSISTPRAMSLSSFIEFSRQFVKEAMKIVSGLINNAEKKALVLEYAGKLFDIFEPLIKVRYPYLNWLFILLGGTNGLKDEFLQAITLLIEIIYVEEFKPVS